MNLKRIGKALLLPVAIFPLAAILNGIGYGIEQLDIEQFHFVAVILKVLGESILSHMPMIFSIGVAYELSNERGGFSAFNGLFAFLIVTTLLSSEYVSIYKSIEIIEIDISFQHINNQFIGILSGLIAATCYNLFNKNKHHILNRYFYVLIVTTFTMITFSILLYFIWPFLYNTLIHFGLFFIDKGPIGAAIYAFFNRLLIPFGLHHAINSVFWFDVVGINDIGNFWSSTGVYGVTGMYQAGFFPVMMFGIPAIALAMYKTADNVNKKKVFSFLFSAAFTSFFTGVTEPLEFAFMFLAPGLYLLHAFFTGLCVFIAASFEWIAGFSFSAGLIDFLLSLNMPMAKSPWTLMVLGIGVFFLYYVTFVFCIQQFNLTTIGKNGHMISPQKELTKEEIENIINIIIEGVGGIHNIKDIDCCITRLRIQLHNPVYFNFEHIKKSGAIEYKQFYNEYQIIYGPQVDIITSQFEKRIASNK